MFTVNIVTPVGNTFAFNKSTYGTRRAAYQSFARLSTVQRITKTGRTYTVLVSK